MAVPGYGERVRGELRQVVGAARNVSADEVRIVFLVLCAVHRVTGQDQLREAGSEPFNLALDRRGHVLF